MPSEMPRLMNLTTTDGRSFGLAVQHIVAIFPMENGTCQIVTTPGITYEVRESEHEIDRKWR